MEELIAKFKNEYLKLETINGKWSSFVIDCINKQSYVKLCIFLSNPLNRNNWPVNKINYDMVYLDGIIHHFTFDEKVSKDFVKFLEYEKERKKLKDFSVKDGVLFIELKNGFKIKAQRLSDKLNGQSKLCKILTSRERLSDCHHGSFMLAHILANNAKIVTSYIKPINNNNKLLHTFIETVNKDGKEIVIDYTRNAIFRKADYYEMLKVEPIIKTDTKEFLNTFYKLKGTPLEKLDIRIPLIYFNDVKNLINKLKQESKNEN